MSTEKEPKQSESGSGLDAAAEGRTVESGVGVGELSAEEWARVTERAGKADQYQEAWMRVAADLENFKKRAARERVEASKFANEALLGRIIPVLDTFEMALAAAANTQATSVQSLQTGIQMIYQQLRGVLTEAGLSEIEAGSMPFDPNIHEAVSQSETSEVPEGHVLQQIRKGYRLKERLLRPAAVVVAVAKKPTL